jgi:hypothetical protein
MLSKFYLMQRNGVPVIWQANAKRMVRLRKNRTEFTAVSEMPFPTRAEALTKLREIFPGARPLRSN